MNELLGLKPPVCLPKISAGLIDSIQQLLFREILKQLEYPTPLI